MGAALTGPQGSIELGSSIVGVGRSPDNQLIVNDSEVSWHHAQIFPQGQVYFVVDLGSRNGTFVNGQKLPPQTPFRLNTGDTVRFGNTMFSYMPGTFPQPPTRLAATASMPNGAEFQVQRPPVKPDAPSEDGTPLWIKITGGLASLATVFAAIWGIYTYLHPTPGPPPPMPTPTPLISSIPQLHTSYTGSLVDEKGQPFALLITSLAEDANGNFRARGGAGTCTGTIKGVIKSDKSINFILTEDIVSGCGTVGTFSGQLYADGHIAGDWQGSASLVGGTWTAS